MSTVPIGYLVTVTLAAWCTMLALVPLRRLFALGAMSFLFGFVLNELLFVAFYWLLASTLLAIDESHVNSGAGWVALGLSVLTTLGLAVVVWRALRADSAVDDAPGEIPSTTPATRFPDHLIDVKKSSPRPANTATNTAPTRRSSDGMHAPPFVVAHGDKDTLLLVETACFFVEKLRSTGSCSRSTT